MCQEFCLGVYPKIQRTGGLSAHGGVRQGGVCSGGVSQGGVFAQGVSAQGCTSPSRPPDPEADTSPDPEAHTLLGRHPSDPEADTALGRQSPPRDDH